MNYLSIDLESFVYPNYEPFLSMSTEQREAMDNGYLFDSSIELLELLSKYNSKATFFFVSEQSQWKKNPLNLIKNSGHEIAHHSHRHIITDDYQTVVNDLELSKLFIEEYKPKIYRSPALRYNENLDPILKKLGFFQKSNYFHHSQIFEKNDSNEKLTEVFISKNNRFWKKKHLISKMSLPNLLKYEYFGSAFIFSLINTNKIIRIVKERERKGIDNHLFLHNWQLFKNNDSLKIDRFNLKKNIAYFPYTFCVKKKFEELLKFVEFKSINNVNM